jgi:hypothetical protein
MRRRIRRGFRNVKTRDAGRGFAREDALSRLRGSVATGRRAFVALSRDGLLFDVRGGAHRGRLPNHGSASVGARMVRAAPGGAAPRRLTPGDRAIDDLMRIKLALRWELERRAAGDPQRPDYVRLMRACQTAIETLAASAA